MLLRLPTCSCCPICSTLRTGSHTPTLTPSYIRVQHMNARTCNAQTDTCDTHTGIVTGTHTNARTTTKSQLECEWSLRFRWCAKVIVPVLFFLLFFFVCDKVKCSGCANMLSCDHCVCVRDGCCICAKDSGAICPIACCNTIPNSVNASVPIPNSLSQSSSSDMFAVYG